MGMGWILFALISFAWTAEARPPATPEGSCYSPAMFTEVLEWCQRIRATRPLPTQYICTDDGTDLTVAQHNYRKWLRVEDRPLVPVILSCGRLCGVDPYLARTGGAYAYLDEEREYVDSVIYCRCPNIASGGEDPLPSPRRLRAKLAAARRYEEVAEGDRLCSGRRSLSVEKHNARLQGKWCSETRPQWNMECPPHTVDHCSLYENPNAVNAMPWIHRCIPFPGGRP